MAIKNSATASTGARRSPARWAPSPPSPPELPAEGAQLFLTSAAAAAVDRVRCPGPNVRGASRRLGLTLVRVRGQVGRAAPSPVLAGCGEQEPRAVRRGAAGGAAARQPGCTGAPRREEGAPAPPPAEPPTGAPARGYGRWERGRGRGGVRGVRVWRLCRSAETHCFCPCRSAPQRCRGAGERARAHTHLARARRRPGVRAWQIAVGGAKPRSMYVLLSRPHPARLHARFLALWQQP